MAEAREFFRKQVEDYDREHYGERRSFMSERLTRMREAIAVLNLPSTTRVLEAGCGPGHLMAALASMGFSPTAIDTSPQMLQLTAARLSQLSPPCATRLSIAELERLPFPDNSFGLVCTAGVVEYLEEDERAVRELTRVLSPGGFLLYPITNSRSPALCLDTIVEGLKRQPRLLTAFNRVWTRSGRAAVRPRHFVVRRQSPGTTRQVLRGCGLDITAERYFYYVPFPHPIDRLFPAFTDAAGAKMDGLANTPLASIAEGLLLVAQKSRARVR